jgi:hypothetical protein
MPVEQFLAGSRLYWAFHTGCPDSRSPAFAGPLVKPAQLRDLGKGGYKQAADCGKGDIYSSADYTRPFGKKRAFGNDRRRLSGREGFYLELKNELRTRAAATLDEGDQKVLKSVPVYYENHDEGAGRRITYWFFYAFSFPTGTDERIGHEGDWERISVFVKPAGPNRWLPHSVRYHQHDGSIDVPWADVRKAPDESGVATHPRAYSAKGSHATYRRGGRYLLVLARGNKTIVAVRDDARACPDCPLWFTWRKLVDAQAQDWYGFGGAWGKVGDVTDFTGPLGPSLEKTVDGKAPSPTTSLQQASDAPVAATEPRDPG